MASAGKARGILQNVLPNIASVAADADIPDPPIGTAMLYMLDAAPDDFKLKRTDAAGVTTTVTVTVV